MQLVSFILSAFPKSLTWHVWHTFVIYLSARPLYGAAVCVSAGILFRLRANWIDITLIVNGGKDL